MTTGDAKEFLHNKLTPHNGFGICLGNDWTAAQNFDLKISEDHITLNTKGAGSYAPAERY